MDIEYVRNRGDRGALHYVVGQDRCNVGQFSWGDLDVHLVRTAGPRKYTLWHTGLPTLADSKISAGFSRSQDGDVKTQDILLFGNIN